MSQEFLAEVAWMAEIFSSTYREILLFKVESSQMVHTTGITTTGGMFSMSPNSTITHLNMTS